MQKNKSIKFNFLMNSILTMSQFIFPIITFPYISRVLRPVGVGKIAFASSIVSYFAMFAQLGIPTYGIRACAKVRDNKDELTKIVKEILFINIVMTFISYICLYLCISNIDKLSNEKELFVIISVSILFQTMGVEWLYKALEQYQYITIRSIICKIIAIIMMFLWVHTKQDYMIYGGITIVASSISNIFNFIKIHKYIYIKKHYHCNYKVHLKPIFIFFAMTCATTIYTQLDTVMIGFFCGDRDVGLYNSAVKIKSILVSIVTSLGAVLLPRVSYYIQNKQMDKFWKVSKKAINFVMIVSIPFVIYFILFSKECVLFLAGKQYLRSVLAMQILMPTLVFIGLTNIMGIQILIPFGKEKKVLYSEIIGAIVNLMMNLFLIPEYGMIGAAIGTLVAEVGVFIYQFIVLRTWVHKIYSSSRLYVYIFASLVSMFFCIWIKYVKCPLIFTLMISAVIYFVIYLNILLFLKEELIVEIKKNIILKLFNK